MNSVVLSAREFLGFEICKALLEEGSCVYAFDYGEWDSGLYEEKWLEIGRNANLTFSPVLEEAMIPEKVTCFIPLFDYATRMDEESIYFLKKDLITFMKSARDRIELTVFIAPSQLLNDNRDEYKVIYSMLQECMEIIKEQKWQVVYVPTLFGPWQPEGYLFQQILNEDIKDRFLDDPEDAIFITDAVHTLIKESRKGDNKSRFLLKSEKEGNWLLCLEALKKGYKEDRIILEKNLSDVKVIPVAETVSPLQVFRIQKQRVNDFCK
ncbi:hypothetical protein [Heyndrickxia acidicola]|uniref:Uncharacterized protein n=1 Tax=Heyndrickxia acidicola TaxID=209389 RepID=A0ABU6MDJ8_9BACI|nr:hypothetical protein [Heyndrickxia acidicola]MED1202503.1 hypothetical protein [Heyndrickxia acidicola]